MTLKHSLSEEQLRKLDLTSVKIIQASLDPVLLCDMPPEFAQDNLRMALAKIMVLVSVPAPKDAAEIVLVDFILKNFRAFTAEEIYLAFEMNLLEQYPEEKYQGGIVSRVIPHFGAFNSTYFSKVMLAYRREKQESFRKYFQLRNDKLALDPPKKMNPEQSYHSLLQMLKLDGAFPEAWDYSAVFDYIFEEKKRGDQSEFKKFMAELEKFKIEVETEITIRIDMLLETCSSMIERQTLELQKTEDAIKYQCRRRYVQKYLADKCKPNKSQRKNSTNLFSPAS